MKVFKIIGTTFFSVGLVLLIVAFFIYRSTSSFINESSIARGVVIDLTMELSTTSDSDGSSTSSVYHPIIQYTTEDGEAIRFRGSTGSNPPSFRKGDTINVRYSPDSPYKARIDSFVSLWIFAIITGSIGLPFFILGLVFLLIPVFNSRQEAWLLANGRTITAEIDRVDLNRSIRANGRNPYAIYAQWHDSTSGRIYTFRSKNLWFNPGKYVQTRSVHVRIHPDNPKKYVMDTSFLPTADEYD